MVENTATSPGDIPTQSCVISACGEISHDDSSLTDTAGTDGDPYEDFPEDQDAINGENVQEKPEVALKIARDIREVGNKLFKGGNTEEALKKYQSKSCSC